MLEKNDYVLYKNGHAVGQFQQLVTVKTLLFSTEDPREWERHACIDLYGTLQAVLAAVQKMDDFKMFAIPKSQLISLSR